MGPRIVEEGQIGQNANRALTATAGLGPRIVEEGRPASVRPEGPKSARESTGWR